MRKKKWLESSIEKQNKLKKCEKSDFTVNKIIDTTNLILKDINKIKNIINNTKEKIEYANNNAI